MGGGWHLPGHGAFNGSGPHGLLDHAPLEPGLIYRLYGVSVAYKGFSERMGYFHNEPGVAVELRGVKNRLRGF